MTMSPSIFQAVLRDTITDLSTRRETVHHGHGGYVDEPDQGADQALWVIRQLIQDEREMSNKYVELRGLIPGAFETVRAPTPEQVHNTTTAALLRLRERAIQSGTPIAYRWEMTEDLYTREFAGGWAYVDTREEVPKFIPADKVEEVFANAQKSSDAIVCQEWQEAVAKFNLRPGGKIEFVIGRILNRIRGIPPQDYPRTPHDD